MTEKARGPETAWSSDVLVIGGGFGGLAAAIRSRDGPDASVTLVDKQTIGWGKANKGAGCCGPQSETISTPSSTTM